MIRPVLILMNLWTLTMLIASGCASRDERLAQLARESAAQQARQSEQVAEASAHLTAGAQQLAESTGRSQETLIAMQHELQAEQARVGRQRDALEVERQALARERTTSPLIAAALQQLGVLLACLLPLILGWYVLRAPAANESDQALAEILIDDLAAAEPRLLPHRPSLPALPSAPEPNPSDDPPSSDEDV